jgi:ribosomal-protein-serine acetyltransferase
LPWLDGAKDTADQLKFIQRYSEGAAAGTAFHYAIVSSGEIVGTVSFNNIDELNRCATMGYWLAEAKIRPGSAHLHCCRYRSVTANHPMMPR